CVPPPLGACCLPDGRCAVLSFEECERRTGAYAADHVSCQEISPCPQPPTGACCEPNGRCTPSDTFTCATAGGSYQGNGTDCGAVACVAELELVINEMDYSQLGPDTNEYIELYGRGGMGLFNYRLVLYNGDPLHLGVYRQIVLNGEMPEDGYYVVGTLSVPNINQVVFTSGGIQDGAPDGIALIDPEGRVLEAIAYGGSFVATQGPATGVLFADIGVEDVSQTDDGLAGEVSLQRIPNGVGPWMVTTDGGLGPDGTPGLVNDIPFRAPYGACCLADGFCLAALEEPMCTSQGGAYDGDGSICEDACPVRVGACCLTNGDCLQVTGGACKNLAGSFLGAAQPCLPVSPCPQPLIGACCLAGGGCVIEDAFDCASISGQYRGNKTTCETQDCGPRTAFKINEVYRNDLGIDDLEFIEIFGPGGVALAGLALLVIEGDHTPTGQEGRIDRVWLLDLFTMPADGLFVLGDEAVHGVDFVIGATNRLENDTATFLLIQDFNPADYQQGFDIDQDNDGLVDPGVDLGLIVDGLAIVDDGINAAEPEVDRVYFGLVTVGPHQSGAPAGVARRHDGQDTQTPADFCQLGEAGDGSDGFAAPTPGLPNVCSPCVLPGDGNGEGNLDLRDFARLQECFTNDLGPVEPPLYPPPCLCLDIDADGDIDLIDYADFLAMMGP
ncbi:MAG: hypothetical protein V3W34_01475, partial [Phycisphaerae bacterium]